MLNGFLILIGFQLLGEILSSATDIPIPGPVLGMMLLFLTLQIRGKIDKNLNTVSHHLVQNLTLLFLPAGVGIFFLPESIFKQWPAIGAAIILGTFLSLCFSTWLIKRSLQPKHIHNRGS